jgi:hypothetical protein
MNANSSYSPKNKYEEKASSPAYPDALLADVYFGSPKSNCSGSGICKVMMHIDTQVVHRSGLNCKKAMALVQFADNQSVRLLFIKASMCNHIRQAYLNEEALELREAADLKISSTTEAVCQLAPGKYVCRDSDDYISIDVNLEYSNIKVKSSSQVALFIQQRLSALGSGQTNKNN